MPIPPRPSSHRMRKSPSTPLTVLFNRLPGCLPLEMRNRNEENDLWHLTAYTNLRPTYTAQQGRPRCLPPWAGYCTPRRVGRRVPASARLLWDARHPPGPAPPYAGWDGLVRGGLPARGAPPPSTR